jgi:hypothetical protein
MTAKYWIAKYIEDPFKNEPRNVGVIVELSGVFAARFVGEKEDGSFDGRKVARAFAYPLVYSQWRNYWRVKLNNKDIDAVVKATSPNFVVVHGGEVSDTGRDAAADVCYFLYALTVGSGPVEAFEWTESVDEEVDLADDIASELRNLQLLGVENQLIRRHPILKEQEIVGRHVTHKPSFSQRNGQLYVMEHIDLNHRRVNKTKERAGWIAYMFSDIRDREQGVCAYSIVRPESENANDQIEYAKAVLAGESIIVNWADTRARSAFIEERQRVADMVG